MIKELEERETTCHSELDQESFHAKV